MKFKVIREHLGDRFYKVGETREAQRGDVAHLIGTTLAPSGKAAKPAKNKAAPPVSNKAEQAPTNKAT
ncbi:hypothetical protein [Kaistia defluvii]|uniref:Uncharacterized protein n=1 Tax=Kaistia defluvii TaxID=410841 RepID=A0ABV2R4H5_9HYPH